jgi:Zn-dependent protease
LLGHMLGWSMNLFRVRGIRLALHFSFFLLLGAYAFAGWADGGVTGMLWHVLALVTFFACVVLHELGHCFTAMHFGIGVRRILLLPVGGMAEFESIPRLPRLEILITLAGPAVNFVIAALLWIALPAAPAEESATMNLLEFGHMLLLWNLLMGGFNLLPAFPMDGGRILRALLALRFNYLRATFWAVMISKLMCAIGIVIGFVYDLPMVTLLFAFILVIGEMEYRMIKRREEEDANLRMAFSAMYDFPPPTEEPPLLRR